MSDELNPINHAEFNVLMSQMIEVAYESGQYRLIAIFAKPGDPTKDDDPPIKVVMSHNIGDDLLFKFIITYAAAQVVDNMNAAVTEMRTVGSGDNTKH
jgi:hypothetical protein